MKLTALTVFAWAVTFVWATSAEPPDQRAKLAVDRLAADLGSADYRTRDLAMRRLIAAGGDGVGSAARLAETGNAESSWRALKVLHEVAVSTDPADRRAALVALVKLRASKNERIAKSANAIVSRWRQKIHDRAASRLQSLGAQVSSASGPYATTVAGFAGAIEGPVGGPVIVEAVGPKGRRVVFRVAGGKAVAVPRPDDKPAAKPVKAARPGRVDEATGERALVEKLLAGDDAGAAATGVSLSESWRGTPVDLEQLANLRNVTTLSIRGPQFTDAMLPTLGRLKKLTRLNLYNVKMTSAALWKLEDARPELYIYAVGSGFLGVNASDHAQGMLVSRVYPGSCADKMGVKVGDVVTTVNGRKMQDLGTLTLCVFDRPKDHPIEIALLRSGKRLTLKGRLTTRAELGQ